jgi:hypothetical protein
MAFLHNHDVIVPIAHADQIKLNPDDNTWAVKHGDEWIRGFTFDQVERCVTALLPADGWELLRIVHDEHGYPNTVAAAPLVAWGLSLFGHLMPIGPQELSPNAEYAIRRVGQATVYLPNLQEVYIGADACLEAEQETKDRNDGSGRVTADAPVPHCPAVGAGSQYSNPTMDEEYSG